MPRSGLLVCNHLSYLDIVVLSSIRPCIFVAKRDVAAWPLFGWLARAAGTIFVDRERRLRVRKSCESYSRSDRRRLSGRPVSRRDKLRWLDGLAIQVGLARISRATSLSDRCRRRSNTLSIDGSVADEVCYWRDMTLVPHLLNLFFKREIRSKCSFSPPKIRAGNRKEIARELRDEVVSMRS